MRVARTSRIFALVLLLAGPLAAHAQRTVTLAQAVALALENSPEHKIALADQKIAVANLQEARSALLPEVTFVESATRGNDPVYVFGTKLRQQSFNALDFSLNRLNTPTPIGNFSSQFTGKWTLFDSMGTWKGVSRARDLQRASGRQLERADQELVFRVVDAYLSLQLAIKRQELSEQTLRTAGAILQLSRARYETGVVVESDLLNARVRSAEREQELVRAQNAVALARAQLNLAIGLPADADIQTLNGLAEPAGRLVSLGEAERRALDSRPDLKKLAALRAGQENSVGMAKSAFGPRVNAFASWETESRALFANGGNNWLAGVEIEMDLFQGGAKAARLQRERAAQEKLAAVQQQAEDAVRLEVRRAFYDLDSARRQVAVARVSLEQARESLRIGQDRYQSGLTTISDLLGVEEALTSTVTSYWEAVYRQRMGQAALELAAGTLDPQSPVVTP